MGKVLSPFTHTYYVEYDEEGAPSVVAEPYDEDGNLKEGVFPEHVNLRPGDDFDGDDAPVGFVEGAAPTTKDDKPALKKDSPAT